MSEPPITESSPVAAVPAAETPVLETPTEPPPSYVKLAMRNMVRKGGKSLFHFTLTAIGLMGVFVGLAYLTH
ncbi:MAG: DUF3285 domain-containing protein [Leptolyngbya sp. RL_3_1]|nr:DUF3285 domain-containing protein [Leptolyngbya sp. RL_3_1]